MVLGALLVAPAAEAQTIRVNGGSTTLKPDSGAVRAIFGLGIDVSAVAPGRAGPGQRSSRCPSCVARSRVGGPSSPTAAESR